MEVNDNNLSERILQLTLEIIYLLTGEDNIVAKKTSEDGQYPVMIPLHFLLIGERNNDKKVREVTQKIIDLLTGEVDNIKNSNAVKEECMGGDLPFKEEEILPENEIDGSTNGNPPERCPHPLYSQDSTQEDHTIPHHDQSGRMSNIAIKEELKEQEDGVMEEWEYMEEHKDPNKGVMMENQPPLTSPDGSSNKNLPERSPRLYSRDSTQADHTIPHHDQAQEVTDMKTEVKEEEEMYVKGDQLSTKEAENMVASTKEEPSRDISTDGSSNRNQLEIDPRPLYSQDSTQEDHSVPHHNQGEDMKTEFKAEGDTYVRAVQLSLKESEIMVANTKPESCLDVSIGGHDSCNTSEGNPILPPDCNEDNGMAQYSPSLGTQYIHHKLDDTESSTDSFIFEDIRDRARTAIPNVQPSCHSPDGSTDPSNPEESSSTDDPYPCSECAKSFKKKKLLNVHLMSHAGKKIYSCPECENLYLSNSGLIAHMRVHSDDKSFKCSECGEGFGLKSQLTAHQRVHTDPSSIPRRFSCSECGKCFKIRQHLVIHQRTHTGVRPYSCNLCGWSFTLKMQLRRHHLVHTGERAFHCPECSKTFATKSNRDNHLRTHTGEQPYSCSYCKKRFAWKDNLSCHERKHYEEKTSKRRSKTE